MATSAVAILLRQMGHAASGLDITSSAHAPQVHCRAHRCAHLQLIRGMDFLYMPIFTCHFSQEEMSTASCRLKAERSLKIHDKLP